MEILDRIDILILRELQKDAIPEEADSRYYWLLGSALAAAGDDDGAISALQKAESLDPEETLYLKICKALEGCYTRREDYRMAYMYAAKRLK